MDYEKLIHSIVDPIIESPESILIRTSEGTTPKDLLILIVAEKDDCARLIGKKGSVANAIREVLSVAGKSENIHVHIKFESFDEGKVED